ncbi:hypothetical protein OGAPHI_002445 [Ogataea philodendri]|uniref:Zn(2)-C6 fungal-type domain-containing protein n=1 Tax=Ogataea philodendri TaxID=1378263 RepID=A0A9P8T870_9ASCO|nr:uncharacterized protein OGAPHI_002445 [Ogataea philodendri]KAH3668691.1 hypothetical protein OGAPHI_002445 [Ogataea philodendri]
MSIHNYVKSRVPITDLSNYSLSLNDNIPTYNAALAMAPRLNLPSLPKLSLPVPQPRQLEHHMAPGSKFDLLIQTAAMQSVQTQPQTSPNYVLAPKAAATSPKLEISNVVIETTPNESSPSPPPVTPINLTSIKLASPSTASKRQRSGPSCDCCRSRKIKCDSEIFVLADLPKITSQVPPQVSEIANCNFLYEDEHRYQYFQIDTDQYQNQRFNSKLSQFKYLKFRPCSACSSKKLTCCFSKGFTRNDIIKFNKSERMHHTPEREDVKEDPVFPIVMDTNFGKHPKKTSCNTCRYKKIKCIKLEGSSSSDCVSCAKKHLECAYA